MARVKTKYGFFLEVEDDVKVGDVVSLELPEIENPTSIPKSKLNFIAQMYGSQKNWNQKNMAQFKTSEDLSHFPSEILNLNIEQLKEFMPRLYSPTASLIKHYSGTNAGHLPEVWFRCNYESLAYEIQYLWQRLNVRTRVTVQPACRDKWTVMNPAIADYVALRPYLQKTRNPKITAKIPRMDEMVGFQVKVDEYKIQDKVVEIL